MAPNQLSQRVQPVQLGHASPLKELNHLDAFDWAQTIEDLRKRILEQSSPQGALDPRDLERVQADDAFVARFIKEYYEDHPKKPLDMAALDRLSKNAHACLVMRAELGINDLRLQDFPFEMYDAKVFCGYEQPDDPKVFIFASASRLRTISGWKETYANFCISVSQVIVTRLNGRRLHLVIDAQNISLMQIEPLVSLAYTLQNCFPGTIGAVSIVDLPFLLRTGLYMLLKMFPERLKQRVHIVTRHQIVKSIGLDLLPEFFGGRGKNLEWTSDPKIRPPEAITVEELGQKLGQSQSSCDKFRKSLLN